MALAELLEALRAQAAARRASELARADAAVQEIRARSARELERRRAELVFGARREAEEAARRAASAARAEGAERVLVARSRLLERVRGALEDRIRGAAEHPGYLESLARDVSVALERLPPGPVVVRARPDLVGRIEKAVGGRRDVHVEPAEEMGVGFVASSVDHGVEVDGTLGARLQHAWPRLAVTVLAEIDA